MHRSRSKEYLTAFGLCFVIGVLSLLPLTVYDFENGQYFSYIIDYNSQMLPFNTYVSDFLKNGGSFSWATDLGSGFFNSYTYYGLCSPFAWPLFLLPSRLVPWAMPLLLCFKYAVAGGGAYLWLGRQSRNENLLIAIACVYAFSGQMIYNLLYYFFLDSFALFPYLLYALDNLVLDDKRGQFWFALFLCSITNYFFLVAELVFIAIYTAVMFVCGVYHFSWRKAGIIILEGICGVLSGMVVLLPSALYMLQSNRATSKLSGNDILFYKETETYLALLKGLLLLPDRPGSQNYLNSGVVSWSTPTNYLPFIGISAIVALYRKEKNHPFVRLLSVLLIFALIPILNSSFVLFNSSYYSRWFFMAALIMCGASAYALGNDSISQSELKASIFYVGLATCALILFAVLPSTDVDGNSKIGIVQNQLLFWVPFLITLAAILAFYHLVKTSKSKADICNGLLVPVVLFCSIGSAAFHILAVADGSGDPTYIDRVEDAKANLSELLPDTENARIDIFQQNIANIGVVTNKSAIQSYSSTVASAITRFYNALGIKRGVMSTLGEGLYGFRGLFSVKYLIVPLESVDEWESAMSDSSNDGSGSFQVDFFGEKTQVSVPSVALTGWTRIGDTACYVVYENDNFVPMGFAYDSYITEDQLDDVPTYLKSNLLMKGILLSDKQIEEFGNALLSPLDDIPVSELTYDSYISDCSERRAEAVESFTQTITGFIAETNYAEDKLVFFSVPYDDGFTATINGEKAEILDVDNGMMAIKVPSGENHIVFTYHTPGLKTGCIVSVIMGVAYCVYQLYARKKRALEKLTER